LLRLPLVANVRRFLIPKRTFGRNRFLIPKRTFGRNRFASTIVQGAVKEPKAKMDSAKTRSISDGLLEF
jgi:hypothetical protein